MRVRIVTPAARGSRKGNRIGAERWARLLRELGHAVVVTTHSEPRAAEVLLALHARRSAEAVARFAERFPQSAIVVALTGTDLYCDAPKHDRQALASMERADRLLVLQPAALRVLPPAMAAKARVVPQSVVPLASRPPRRRDAFELCVVGHLRHVKDPLRAAMAARSLPTSSRIAVLQAGAVLESRFETAVAREAAANPRFEWLGELSHAGALRLIARSRGLVISSRAEGGAHVVSEAIVVGTPVLASDISGNVGMLGDDYPGLFPVADTRALSRLMHATETDAAFRRELERRCRALAPTYRPATERAALARLLQELA